MYPSPTNLVEKRQFNENCARTLQPESTIISYLSSTTLPNLTQIPSSPPFPFSGQGEGTLLYPPFPSSSVLSLPFLSVEQARTGIVGQERTGRQRRDIWLRVDDQEGPPFLPLPYLPTCPTLQPTSGVPPYQSYLPRKVGKGGVPKYCTPNRGKGYREREGQEWSTTQSRPGHIGGGPG